MRDQRARWWYAVRVSLIAGVIGFVGISYVGCEEEPTRPESCGSGQFARDDKTGICRRLSDNAIVDSECCDY